MTKLFQRQSLDKRALCHTLISRIDVNLTYNESHILLWIKIGLLVKWSLLLSSVQRCYLTTPRHRPSLAVVVAENGRNSSAEHEPYNQP